MLWQCMKWPMTAQPRAEHCCCKSDCAGGPATTRSLLLFHLYCAALSGFYFRVLYSAELLLRLQNADGQQPGLLVLGCGFIL